MPAAGRLGDKAFCPSDSHGCLACSHPVSGPAVQGSPDVFTNSMPSVRVGDAGIHSACCGPNTWTAAKGSATVFINGAAAHRMGDKTTHCGGTGQLVEGSANVFIGDGTGSVGASGSFQETSLEDSQKSIFKQGQMSERPFCEVCEAGKDRESQEADAFIVPQPEIYTQLSSSVAAQASTLIAARKKGTAFCELCSMSSGASSQIYDSQVSKIARKYSQADKHIETGLGEDIDNIVKKSPTFQKNIIQMQKDGWTIEYGREGKGSYANKSKKKIVIDSKEKDNPASMASILSHESGHALYKEEPYIQPAGLTKEEYVKRNAERYLKDEGEATLVNVQVRLEIMQNSGPDIGIIGKNAEKYQYIFDKYPEEKDRDKARQEIGEVFAKGENPSVDSIKTYEDYYSKFYSDFYDETLTNKK